MPRRNGVFMLEPVIEQVDLPVPFEGLWVKMNVTPTSKDLEKWQGDQGGIYGLADCIKEWNLVDSKDKPLPITADTLMLVPIKLIGALKDEWQERALGVPKTTAIA